MKKINNESKNIRTKNYSFKELFKILKSMFSLLSDYKFKVFICFILAIISTTISLIIPLISAEAINVLFYGFKEKISGLGGIDFERLAFVILQIAIFCLIQFVLNTTSGFISTKISKIINFDLRKKICKKIYKLPSLYFENTNRGEILSLLINDIEQIGENITSVFIEILNVFYLTISSLALMFYLNVPLSICALIIIPLGSFVILLITKRAQKYYFTRQNLTANINSYLDETLNGLKIIRIYNKKEETLNTFNKQNEQLYKNSMKGQMVSAIGSPISRFFDKVYYLIIVIFGAYLCVLNLFTVGDIQAFINYLQIFNSKTNSILGLFNQTQSMCASFERIDNYLKISDFEVDSNDEILSDGYIQNFNTNKMPIIQFENINFKYKKDTPIINDFSLDIYKGETIAIVGPTGAGKTTLIKLLLRFYDNYAGSIKLYGHDIKKLNFSEVRKHFGVVLQNIWLFFGTIEDNIKYGNSNATNVDVENAAKISRADKFINLLPDKFKTWIFEGGISLSRGQIQLLAIARAVVSERNIIILDEATSSVDTKTEEEIFDAFDNLIEQKTSIIIAHRLSTIINADKIVVINNGDIVEIGNHKDLMSKKGFYYDIYKSGLNSKLS